METQKRRRGDRRDGRLLRELDSLHFITGIIYPNRCDNEAYISERIDLTPVKAYMARRNETEKDFPYTYFHLVLTALVKTITLRPKMNRFIVNGNFFQRNEVTASFVVKKQFSDKGAEALAMLHTTGDDTIDTVHEYIRQQVTECRSDKVDSTTGEMDILNKLPRWLGKAAVRFIMWLDKRGWVPDSMTCNDPLLQLRGAVEPGLHQAQVRLSPPDQLGHLLRVLHHRRKEDESLLRRRRQRDHAGDPGPGSDHRRAPGRRLLLFQVHPAAEVSAGAPGGAGEALEGGSIL